MKQLFFAFGRNQRGNVAMMFGLCVIGVIGLVGLAVDYARQQNIYVKIQAASDHIALALALDARILSAIALQARAQELFDANMASMGLKSSTIQATYTAGDPARLQIVASGSVSSEFGRFFGVSGLPVSGYSVVPISQTSLEIALVLDNTGSMGSSNKLVELKKASKTLVSLIKSAAEKTSTTAKISIVPFDTSVKIPTSNASQPWLDWSKYSSSQSNWTGCLMDRSPPFDTRNTTPNGDPFTWYPTTDCGVTELTPLTSDWTALNTKIDQMVAAGMTNATIGIAWGFNMLTYGAPLSTAAEVAPGLAKYMIVLTDGMNTKNRWTNDSPQIDARTIQACENAKAAGITIFTVRVKNGSQVLIQSCASDAGKYYSINDAADLTSVFQDITSKLVAKIYLGG